MTDHIWWGLQTIGQESIPEEHSSWAGIDIKETLCWEHSNHLIYNGSLQVLICGCGSEYGGVDADRFLDWNHGGKVGELRREAVSEDIDKDSGCGKLRVGVHVVSGCHRHLSTTQNCLIISLFINNAHQTNSTTVKHCNYFKSCLYLKISSKQLKLTVYLMSLVVSEVRSLFTLTKQVWESTLK